MANWSSDIFAMSVAKPTARPWSASLSEAELEQVKVYGPLLVLHHLAKKFGLPARLGPYSEEILSMVSAATVLWVCSDTIRRGSRAVRWYGSGWRPLKSKGSLLITRRICCMTRRWPTECPSLLGALQVPVVIWLQDRANLTGARWRLSGAEAVLRLRQ